MLKYFLPSKIFPDLHWNIFSLPDFPGRIPGATTWVTSRPPPFPTRSSSFSAAALACSPPALSRLVSQIFSHFLLKYFQPLDLVKNRMQVTKTAGGTKPSTLSVISGVIRNEGIGTLYNGLSAGLLRQATYTTTRYYENIRILNIKY